MKIPPLFRFALLSLGMSLAGFSGANLAIAAEPAAEGTLQWHEDFSDPEGFQKAWTPYGFLASGIDAAHPMGLSVSGSKSRSDWWQLADGVLLCQNFPEEKHPAGITRAASGSNIRLGCRLKLQKGGSAQITIRGNNPIVERNFHVAVFRIQTDSVSAAENDVKHPKDSPEAAAMKQRGEWNRKFFIAKTIQRTTAPDVWHDLALEIRGREMTAYVDGEKVLAYTTLCGDVAKTSIGLAGGRSGSGVMQTWFDDVDFGPVQE